MYSSQERHPISPELMSCSQNFERNNLEVSLDKYDTLNMQEGEEDYIMIIFAIPILRTFLKTDLLDSDIIIAIIRIKGGVSPNENVDRVTRKQV